MKQGAIHRILAACAVLAAAIGIGWGLSALLHDAAYASNVSELDDQIVAKQIEADEMKGKLEGTEARINELTVAMYRYADPSAVLDTLFASRDIKDFLVNLDYFNRIHAEMTSSVASLREQTAALEGAQRELEMLREEKAIRVKSASEAFYDHYAQGDGRWGNLEYWGGTLSWTGCGLCAYTSAIDILTGQSLEPPAMLEMRGDWMGMDHYPDHTIGTPDGSTHAELTKRLFDLDCYNCDGGDLLDEISDPNAVAVVLVRGQLKQNGGGWWWTAGHYVCAYDYSDGVLHVQDPAGLDWQGQDVQYSGSEIDTFVNEISSVVVYRN